MSSESLENQRQRKEGKSFQPDSSCDPAIELTEVCSRCGRPKGNRKKSSFTTWLFRPATCDCRTEAAVAPASEGKSIKLRVSTGEQRPFPDLGDQLEVLEFIGEGGMGSVFKVHDRRVDREFAVKVLHQELVEEKSARFEQEVESAANLDHPNLITIYSHDMAPDQTPYMVMDFIDGPSMAELLEKHVFIEPQRAIDLFIQICEGVSYLHAHGLVHLDLKPSNVLITQSGTVEIARVGDFGIAQVMTGDAREITQTEEIVGSLPYMSPEHCRGESLDERSDIYSLGCLMYEVLTGKPPFLGENPVKTIMKHVQDKPQRMKSRMRRLDIPESLEKVVLFCLEKSSRDRYGNVEELVKDLEQIRDGLPPIVIEQRLRERNQDRGLSGTQKKVIAVVSLTALTGYFIHLSEFDTISQIAYCTEAIWFGAIGWLFAYLAYLLSRVYGEVSLRLKHGTTTKSGDRWLQMTALIGSICSGAFTMFLIAIILRDSQVTVAGEFLNLVTSREIVMIWQIVSAIAIVSFIVSTVLRLKAYLSETSPESSG